MLSVEPARSATAPPWTRRDRVGAETARVQAARFTLASRGRWIALGVALLLELYAVMAWTASLSKGVSFDEGLQLAVGYNLWLNDDYRMEGGNGDLIKRWATLPYLITKPKFVSTDDPMWKSGSAYDVAHRFLFESGNRPESLLQQSRAMMALVGVVAGQLIFWCSREVFGAVGGLISLALFAFSPHMLAFGGIVSTDMSITVLLLGSTWCIWRLLHEVTCGRVMASLVVFGLLLLAKLSALVIFPVTVVLLAIRLMAGGELIVRWSARQWSLRSRSGQAGVFAGLVLLHAIAGWTAIWAHYGFRYTASSRPADPSVVIPTLAYRDHVSPLLTRIVKHVADARIFPEGYVRGIDALLGNDDEMGAFRHGEWYIGGRPTFFPYAIWVKTQPALPLLLALGAAVWWRASRNARNSPGSTALMTGPSLYAVTPHLVLIGCYLAVAMVDDFNIGHRHVLPIYPSLYVLAAAVAIGWTRHAPALKAAVAALIGWLVADSLLIRPHYLSYFGPQAGGAENGYKHLVDSSLDWGMDLPALRDWLDEHDPKRRVPLFLGYFGTDSPRFYGIKSRRLPGFIDRRNLEHYYFAPGYYAISASLFQGVYTAAFGPWSKDYEERYQITLRNVALFGATESNPVKRMELIRRTGPQFWEAEFDHFDNLRFARLCAWLRQRGEPQHRVGHSIFIWKLDHADLYVALHGPPPELVESPPLLRRFRQFVANRN